MGRKRNKKILRLRTKPKPKPKTPPGETRNWLELPRDVTVSILTRLRAVDIVESGEKVCTAWRSICKDPLTWRTIDMRNEGPDEFFYDLDKMCRHLVDRSQGNLVDLNLECFASDDLLKYIANRCGGIRRLRLAQCYGVSEGLSDIASKLPLLEELEISLCNLSHKSLEVIGRSCPLLKSFKLNNLWYNWPEEDDNAHVNAVDLFGEEYFLDGIDDDDDIDDAYHGVPPIVPCKDDDARAIAGTMRGLHHLQLFGNQLTEDGLKEILDSCPHLDSLDLRYCLNLQLKKRDLRKRCAERIKKLRLPYDPIGDYEFPATVYGDGGYSDGCEDYDEYGFGYGYQSDDSEWYDDFTKVRFSDQFSDEEEIRRTLHDDYIY